MARYEERADFGYIPPNCNDINHSIESIIKDMDDLIESIRDSIKEAKQEGEPETKIAKMRVALKRTVDFRRIYKGQLKQMQKENQGILSFWHSNCGRMYECRLDCQVGCLVA